MPHEPTYLGTVEDVSGASISIALAKETVAGLTFITGVAYRIGQVGAFVRIPIGYVDLFGIVTQVGAGAVPEKIAAIEPHGHRWMTVELIGEGERDAQFQRGLSQSPAVGDPVHLVTVHDLRRIYGRPDEPRYVSIGRLASAESIPALINIDKLVTRHCAILGATGAGKSTTVASILNTLSDATRYPSARIVVFDIHGEYANALRDRATVYRVNGNEARGEQPLFVPYWAMNFDELLPLTFGDISNDAALGALSEKILEFKKAALIKLMAAKNKAQFNVTEAAVTVDTPIPFSIHQLWFELCELVKGTHTVNDGQTRDTFAYELDKERKPLQPGDPEKVIPPKFRPMSQAAGQDKIFQSKAGINLTINRQLDALASRLRDPRLDFLFRPGPWSPGTDGVPQEDLDTLLKRWLGGKQPIVILDLSGVPVSILNALIGSLLRIIYDALFWSRNLPEGGKERPLLLVLEEAHLYLGKTNEGAAATQAGTAVRRIAKEGRKYGIGAMIVSQRPSEVDDTILSQCGTLFALRMSNESDRGHVTGTVTDNLKGLLSNLPILRTGEAVIVGEAVHLPMRALIEAPPPDRRPNSADPLVFGGKFDENPTDPGSPGGWEYSRQWDKTRDYEEIVEVWRLQQPRPTREKTSPLKINSKKVK